MTLYNLGSVLRWGWRTLILPVRTSVVRKRLHKNGYEVLFGALQIINKVGLRGWLDFGTLLGFVRNGGFVRHDLDIDIGLLDFIDLDKPRLIDEFLGAGFSLVHQIEIDDVVKELSFSKSGVKIDLFFYTRKDSTEKMYCYLFDKQPDLSWKESMVSERGLRAFEVCHSYSGVDQLAVGGTVVPVPRFPERHLVSHYGEDFMTERKSWNSFSDSKNVIETSLIGRLKHGD